MRRATRPRFAACGGLVPFSAAFGRFVVILVFAGGRGLFERFAASAISATASVASVESQGRVKRDFLLSLIHCRIGTNNVLSMFGHGEYGSRSCKRDELSHLLRLMLRFLMEDRQSWRALLQRCQEAAPKWPKWIEWLSYLVGLLFVAFIFGLFGNRPYVIFAVFWLFFAVCLLNIRKAAPKISEFGIFLGWFMLAVMAMGIGFATLHSGK